MNRKLSAEYERAKRLAKALARLERQTVILYKKNDGTYDYDPKDRYIPETFHTEKEYITQY